MFGESSGKKIAFPERPPEAVRQQIVDTFAAIKSEILGPAALTDQARGMLQTIYNSFEGLDDARFKHYSTRRYTHLLKLCLLVAACNLRTEIRAEDVLFANTLLTFTEHRMPQAMGEFGKAKNADVAARIIAVLSEAKSPIDIGELWKQVQSDLDRIEDLNKLMAGLMQGGKVQYIGRTRTSNVQGYLPVRKMLSNKHVYVDYDLLLEVKRK